MHKFHSPFLRLARLATQQSRLAELELLAARQAEAEAELARQTLLDEQAAWDQEVASADPMLAPLETRLAGLAARENIRALLEWIEQERRRRAALTTEALTRWQQRRQHQAAWTTSWRGTNATTRQTSTTTVNWNWKMAS
jgi:hypothetical protein